MELTICRCELVTEADLHEAVEGWGARSHNEVKLITRAGKGACQGRCCNFLVQQWLAHQLQLEPAAVLPPRSRLPIRPVPVASLADVGVSPSLSSQPQGSTKRDQGQAP